MSEYPFDSVYAAKIRHTLQLALDGATRDQMKPVEATGAMLSLALDVLAVEMPLDAAKQFIVGQLELVTASRAAFGEGVQREKHHDQQRN